MYTVAADLSAVLASLNTKQVSTMSCTTTGVIVEDGTTGAPDVVDVQAAANADTFSAYITLDASTSADSWIQSFSVVPQAGVNDALIVVELAVGAAAAEVVKTRFSFRHERMSDVGYMAPYVFTISNPIFVASGSRISARSATSLGADDRHIWVSNQLSQTLE